MPSKISQHPRSNRDDDDNDGDLEDKLLARTKLKQTNTEKSGG